MVLLEELPEDLPPPPPPPRKAPPAARSRPAAATGEAVARAPAGATTAALRAPAGGRERAPAPAVTPAEEAEDDDAGPADGEAPDLEDVDDDIKADVLKELGNDCFVARDYKAAIGHYAAAIKHMTDQPAFHDATLHVACLNNRAQALMRLNDYAAALADCESVLSTLDADNIKARFRAAACCLEVNRPDACLAHCEHGLRLQPDHAELGALRSRASAFARGDEDKRRVAEQVEADVDRYGYPTPDASGTVSSPSPLLVVEELVNILLDADEATADTTVGASIDVAHTLAQLAAALRATRDARIHFAAIEGHAAVLLHFTHVFHAAASDVLLASVGGETDGEEDESLGVFPAAILRRLGVLALGAGAPPSVASASLGLLERLSRDRVQRVAGGLTLPDSLSSAGAVAADAPSRMRRTGLLAHLTKTLLEKPGALRKFPLEAAQHLVRLLGNFARDSASRAALEKASCAPLVFLLRLYHRAEELLGAFTELDAKGPKIEDVENAEDARAALLRERKRLYNLPVVRLRRAILSALADLVRDPILLREEAFEVTAARAGQRKRTLAKEAFFSPLVKIIRVLIDASPVQLACIYDTDGHPLRYEARPYAADYMATPSGDMLLSLPAPTDDDVRESNARFLRGPYEERKYYLPDFDEKSVYTDLIVSEPQKDVQPAVSAEMADIKANPVTLLERCIDVLLLCTVAHKNAGKALYAHRLLDELERLWRFENPPSLLAKLETLYAKLALRAGEAAAINLAQTPSVHTLAGLMLTDVPKHMARALNRLSIDVATMDGNSLRRLLRVGGGLDKVYGLICFLDAHPDFLADKAFGARETPLRSVLDDVVPPPPAGPGRTPPSGKAMLEMARHIFLTCYERSVSKQDFARWRPPKGHVWDAIGYEEILLMREKITGELRPSAAALAAAARQMRKAREEERARLQREQQEDGEEAADALATKPKASSPPAALPSNAQKTPSSKPEKVAEESTARLPWDPPPEVAKATPTGLPWDPPPPAKAKAATPTGLPWDPPPPAKAKATPTGLPWDPTAATADQPASNGTKAKRAIRRGFLAPAPAPAAKAGNSALAALGDEGTRRLESARAAAAAAEARIARDMLMAPAEVSPALADAPAKPAEMFRDGLASLDDAPSKPAADAPSVGLSLARAEATKAAFATLPKSKGGPRRSKRAADGAFGGRNGAATPVVGDVNLEDEDDGYDSDGLRVEFDNRAPARVRRQREAWLGLDVRRRIRWDQTNHEVFAYIKVPHGTTAREVSVCVTPTRLTVNLSWHGKVFDGPLYRRCKGSEANWILQDSCTPSPTHHNANLPKDLPYDEDMGRFGEPFHEVLIQLPKDDPTPWRALFEGGEEKSHYQVLQEMALVDDEHVSYEEMDEQTRDLVDEMRERREAMATGELDPDGFDDFRLVLSDADGAK